ncbi:MAG: hypothetical protein WBX15_10090 [Thermoanaerobaculia bacterium]
MTTSDSGTLLSVELFDDAECSSILETLQSLESSWERRWSGLPFFTLGAASYLDATEGRFHSYREKAAALNPILREHFGWMYERLEQRLSLLLGRPARCYAPLGLPGFHIFYAHESFEKQKASAHYDLQYELIDWSGLPDPDFVDPLSFTIPVRLPKSGAGLAVWNLDWNELRPLGEEERKRKLDENRKPVHEAYAEGRIFIHSGHRLHQMLPMKNLEGEARITVQGHGVRTSDGWALYW